MVMAVARFESLFRKAASLDVDKRDLARLEDFLGGKLHDLLAVGAATAKANGRDVLLPHDLPITAGLERSIHEFRRLDEDLELDPILGHLATRPPLDVTYAVETEERLPFVLGGLCVALARTFKVLDPDVVNPQTRHWERAGTIFDTLL
ncbi:MAG TPA: DUF1931 family protein [Actinobacteria bacterium]|nr:DUF1931 family protein [Actinomycetota bacterium]